MSDNPFVLKPEEYVRDINFMSHYVKDVSTYLSISTGKPMDVCTDFVTKNLGKDGLFAFKDPKISFLERQENGDRVKTETGLYQYFKDSINDKEIIAPTLTTYLHPDKKKSLLAIYVDENIKARAAAKKEMFAAKAAKNDLLAAVKKIEQTNRKLGNNAISGAHVSPSNPLYNKSAHSTLTSGCRVTSAYGNANNEKIISGNRHYWNHHVVLNNIISIINNFDYNNFEKMLTYYGLKYPTAEETMECILYSSRLYWWDRHYVKEIEDLVNKLTPIQRAGFVYIGDLYQIKRLNPEFTRNFISELSKKCFTLEDGEIPIDIIKKASDPYLNLAHQICTTETMDIGKDHSKIEGTQAIITLAATVKNIQLTIQKYAFLIKTLLTTKNLPASVSYFPQSVRRTATTSDTDSTIFTVQEWVIWYMGGIKYNDESIAVMATVVFLASSSITHILATMSANLGIITEYIHRIEMKSEFSFHAFVPSQIGKHYFALIGCQEGNVFSHKEVEIKGVNLKSSNLPERLTQLAEELMVEIMETALSGNKLSMRHFLSKVANIEKMIIDSIRKGEFEFLRAGSIKDAETYTADPEDSPYQNHLFWNECFGQKYGEMPKPPYDTAKVSLIVDNPTSFNFWLNGMQDRDLAERISNYFKRRNKKFLTTLHMPVQILQMKGFPAEIVEIIDYRKIVTDLCNIFYIVLECIGYYTADDKVKRLVSDFLKD